ncbi:unnamed protein product [Prorocentrum cordatum]|uniref:Methyltransferase type 11 domain-containing protein n=1 Tax=Prorocentrum cordatum TaxID=2364126 RepID=A0ABN9Q3R7_9DINO|nr:unnamed protein product [Polarella glacialis]
MASPGAAGRGGAASASGAAEAPAPPAPAGPSAASPRAAGRSAGAAGAPAPAAEGWTRHYGGTTAAGLEAPPPYGDPSLGLVYWDARHTEGGDGPYDWYLGFEALRGPLLRCLPPPNGRQRLLEVGCGTSEVLRCLWQIGWKSATGIDISEVAVEKGARLADGCEGLRLLRMDACELDFEDASFDAVFDKGLLDTLATSGMAAARAEALLSHVYRVLKPGGVYALVSHSKPAFRMPYLRLAEHWTWAIEYRRLRTSFDPLDGLKGVGSLTRRDPVAKMAILLRTSPDKAEMSWGRGF